EDRVAKLPELPDALRAALAELAQAEIPEVLAEARSLARARARTLIEGALVEEFLRAAGASGAGPCGGPSEVAEPQNRRKERRTTQPKPGAAEPPVPPARSEAPQPAAPPARSEAPQPA